MDVGLIGQRLAELRLRIKSAGGNNVAIVAVTKMFAADAWLAARTVGCDAVGENYAQELIGKAMLVNLSERLPVHFIGQLQTNKVKSVFDIVDVWQSVDRTAVVSELVKRQQKRGTDRQCEIYLQVNTTAESEKGGCEPSAVQSLITQARAGGLLVSGLMTVGPTKGNPIQTRSAFRLLRRIGQDLGVERLSMGMTDDLEIAVEEGSTMVRIGTSLFGQRPLSR